jgi:uncharacterized repeat protein (TIGR03803 family)
MVRSRFAVVALCLLALQGLASMPAAAQIVSTLYSFGSATGDGVQAYSGLVQDASGNLYGTTAYGGANNAGTVFELVKSGSSYTEKILYNFGSVPGDGSAPVANLIVDASGNLYGVTVAGGAGGAGTVFEMAYSAGNYAEQILYSFANSGSDGTSPTGALVLDASGNLFGTTESGGTSSQGTAFELTKSSGGVYTESVLVSFSYGPAGASPVAGLIMDASGNLFGTTQNGGGFSAGVVFELVNSGGAYAEKVLYSFTNAAGDGANPAGVLVQDSAGNLYGTTQTGGIGYGTVFELVNSSGTYSEKVIYTFTSDGGDGRGPFGGLIRDSAGNLYGTTNAGGVGNNGTVFELSNVSGFWAESLLLIFGSSCQGSGSSTGASPNYANLLMDDSGNLYGTTAFGGANGAGVAFSITKSASAIATSSMLGSSANPVGAGFPVSFTAAVNSASGYPTGYVTLANANGTVGVSGPLVCGVATASFEDALTLGIGTNPVTATYVPASTDGSKSSTTAISQTVTEPGVVLENGGNTLTGTQTITGSVSATSFSGNGSGLSGVTAAGLACAGCVGNTQLGVNYAGSTAQGGPAVNALLLGGLLPSAFQPAGSYVLATALGQPSGVATLDATGKVPSAQLPASSGGGTSTPAILAGWCTGVAASAGSFSFAGLGDPTGSSGSTCSNGTGASTVIGIPVTSAGTLKNLRVYPGAAANSGTNVTFTVYTATAPGWSVGSGPNQAAISSLTFNHTNDSVTLTVAGGASFTTGDQIGVAGIAGTYNAGTNCTSLAGSLFDGTFTVSSATSNSVTYVNHGLPTNCGRNLTAAATGTITDNTTPTTSFVTRTMPTATALTCTIAAPMNAAAVICSDSSHTVTVNAGDVISAVATSTRTSGTETIGNIRVTLEKQ